MLCQTQPQTHPVNVDVLHIQSTRKAGDEVLLTVIFAFIPYSSAPRSVEQKFGTARSYVCMYVCMYVSDQILPKWRYNGWKLGVINFFIRAD